MKPLPPNFVPLGDVALSVLDSAEKAMRGEVEATNEAVRGLAERARALVARDPYQPWRNSLSGERPNVADLPAFVACAGFFRHRTNGDPVALWPLDGGPELAGQVASGRVTEVDEPWMERVFARLDAVTEEDYRSALQTGRWADHAPTRGHNNPPSGIEEVQAELDELVREAKRLVKAGAAKTKPEANTASNLAARIKDLTAAVRDLEKAEVAPLLAEIAPLQARVKATKARFETILLGAAAAESEVRREVIQPFLIEQRRIEREAGNVQQRRDGKGEIAPASNAGAKGRKTKLVTVWHAEVDDYDAALGALRDTDEVKEAVLALCHAAARAKVKTPIPGVRFVSREEAR